MKRHLKKLLFIVSCLGFIFLGCEKDLNENPIKDNASVSIGKINTVSINEVPFLIPQLVKYNSRYSHLLNSDSQNSYKGIEDLELELERILEYAETNGLKSYSIAIKNQSDSSDDMYFENLHIIYVDGEYKPFIARYNATDDSEKFDVATFSGRIKLFSVDKLTVGSLYFENGQKLPDPAPYNPLDGDIGIGGGGGDPPSWMPDWLANIFYHWNANYLGSNSSSSSSSSSSSGNSGTGVYILGTGYTNVGSTTNTPTVNTSGSSGSGTNSTGVAPNEPEWTYPLTSQLAMANKIRSRLIYSNPEFEPWLENPSNLSLVDQIYFYMAEGGNFPENNNFVSNLINSAISETNQADVNNLIGLSLAIQNLGNNPLDDAFMTSIDQYIDASMIDPITMQLISAHYSAQCAVLRYNHPNWSEIKVKWEASKDLLHITLDALGLIPVYGEVADLANGVLYKIDGDNVNATLSVANAIPIAGWVSFSTKYGLKVINVVNDVNTKVRLTWTITNNVVSFGAESTCRAQLRKILGLAVGNPLIAHHIMPISLQTNDIIQKAAKSSSSFHLNEALNGLALNALQHTGNHAVYTDKIFLKLQDFKELNPNATPLQCYNYVTLLINQIKAWVIAHPNTNINLIVLP